MFTFCTNTQFLFWIDWRWAIQNIADPVPIQPGTAQTAPTLLTAANQADMNSAGGTYGSILNFLLSAKSEELMSAAAVAAFYSQADIATNGGLLAAEIVTGLTVGALLGRRVRSTPQDVAMGLRAQKADLQLEQLRKGERIFFNVPNVPQEGTPSVANNRGPLSPPLITERARRYFGFGVGPPFNWPPGPQFGGGGFA